MAKFPTVVTVEARVAPAESKSSTHEPIPRTSPLVQLLGTVARSALKLKRAYQVMSALRRYPSVVVRVPV